MPYARNTSLIILSLIIRDWMREEQSKSEKPLLR